MSNLQQVKATFEKEKEKLVSYIQKSYKARIKWVKTGQLLKAIDAEIGIALAGGRIDLVENLMQRRSNLVSIQKEISRLDYEQRFGSQGLSVPLPEDITEDLETDSTQFSSDTKPEVAQSPNQ